MPFEIEPLDPRLKPAGRWATLTGFLGSICLLMGAAFADYYERRLGIPAVVTYGVAGVSFLSIVMFNLGMSGSLSEKLYGVNIGIFLATQAIMTLLGCVYSYVDGMHSFEVVDGQLVEKSHAELSLQGLGAIGIFVAIFVMVVLAVWRLKASIDRNPID